MLITIIIAQLVVLVAILSMSLELARIALMLRNIHLLQWKRMMDRAGGSRYPARKIIKVMMAT